MTKIAGSGSGSISQRHGSADPDPDPPQNVMDPQHCPTLPKNITNFMEMNIIVAKVYRKLLFESGFNWISVPDPDWESGSKRGTKIVPKKGNN
jgi:hypothetical protein